MIETAAKAGDRDISMSDLALEDQALAASDELSSPLLDDLATHCQSWRGTLGLIPSRSNDANA